ncbi:zinc finger protein [Micractinium conductrix]|uniref:Zinc finger protein n=1 Tax=Micractinium conductrix TaxID=554055 RepID=A0A2P6V8L7_9CHLO|nr:zinc finger protein [Micractinium conductrix]|eukprot:PSC70432.1 zinc finger protein [Micractinium conductrix]
MAAPAEQDAEGLYCSTAGTYFESREDLTEHQRSDFHRYNLKRKIAGLPPVTHEWYEARKAQLLASAATPVQRVWFDPLTRRKFYSENTYLAFTRSKKYRDLVKKSGEAAPAPIVTLRKLDEAPQTAAQQAAQQAAAQQKAAARVGPTAEGPGYRVKPAVHGGPAAMEEGSSDESDEDEEEGVDDGSTWETASEEEMQADEKWEEWDVRRCLFDNKVSPSMEENLEHMFKNFGFYFPDAQYLSDPEGLLKYLGAKLQYGHVPLYESGDNPNAKQFHSLHAVQRHMIDVGKCKMLYDGNEDEYDEFYEYGEEEISEAGALVLSTAEAGPAAAYELVLAGDGSGRSGGGGGGGARILGSREFARYYRQRPRLTDGRASVQAAQVQAQYRRLAVPLLEGGPAAEQFVQQKRWKRSIAKSERIRLKYQVDSYDKINNLPKNVPY